MLHYTAVYMAFRFGSGYTLQAKINPLTNGIVTPETTNKPSTGSLLPNLETTPLTNSKEASVAISYHADTSAVVQGSTADTTGLKNFIEQSFQGARLMEEHQV